MDGMDVVKVIMLAFLGGLSFLVLGMLMGTVNGLANGIMVGLGGIASSVILLLIFLFVATKTKVDDLKIGQLIPLLAGVGIVGGVFTLFFPEFDIVLSVSGVFATVNSFLLVLTSLAIGDIIANMFS